MRVLKRACFQVVKRRKSIFHLFSVLCPIGVNTGQGEHDSGEGRQVLGLSCACLSHPKSSRAEKGHGDKATRQERDCMQLNSLGLCLGCADPTLQEELAPLDARWLGATVYLESHDPHDLVGYR